MDQDAVTHALFDLPVPASENAAFRACNELDPDVHLIQIIFAMTAPSHSNKTYLHSVLSIFFVNV